MERGLRVALSPNEETTLHLIAATAAEPGRLRLSDLSRLLTLRLIEKKDGGWYLTKMGKARADTTEPEPKPTPSEQAASSRP